LQLPRVAPVAGTRALREGAEGSDDEGGATEAPDGGAAACRYWGRGRRRYRHAL